MRKKAAEAWKSEALQRQVAEYERQTLEALSAKRVCAYPHGGPVFTWKPNLADIY